MPNKKPIKAVAPAPPAPPPAVVAQNKSTQFIEILKNDKNFDIIDEILKHMDEIKRAKKIKPLEKHRLLKDYHLTLLSYCLPRIKIQETTGDDTGKGVIFNINIGGDPADTTGALKKAGAGKVRKKSTGAHVTVKTIQNTDGSYSIAD